MNSASNMIAKWYQKPMNAIDAADLREDVRHAEGERRRAAGACHQRLLADLLGQRIHLGDRDRIPPAGDGRDGRLRGRADDAAPAS